MKWDGSQLATPLLKTPETCVSILGFHGTADLKWVPPGRVVEKNEKHWWLRKEASQWGSEGESGTAGGPEGLGDVGLTVADAGLSFPNVSA